MGFLYCSFPFQSLSHSFLIPFPPPSFPLPLPIPFLSLSYSLHFPFPFHPPSFSTPSHSLSLPFVFFSLYCSFPLPFTLLFLFLSHSHSPPTPFCSPPGPANTSHSHPDTHNHRDECRHQLFCLRQNTGEGGQITANRDFSVGLGQKVGFPPGTWDQELQPNLCRQLWAHSSDPACMPQLFPASPTHTDAQHVVAQSEQI